MLYATIISALVGVAGLLYGLLERSKRQAAVEKASTISKQLAQEQIDAQDSVRRYENLVTNMRDEIQRLQKEIDANLPVSALRDRLNDVLSWRVRPPSKPNASGSGMPKDPAPGDAQGNG